MALSVDAWTVIAGAVLNAGALIYIGKKALGKIDQHSEVLGPMVKTLETLAEGQRELFKSRNDHSTRLTEVETIHRLKGCAEPAPNAWPQRLQKGEG